MEKAIAVAKSIHSTLLPHEEEILRLQDVFFFLRKGKMFGLLAIVNIVFFILMYLGISSYSTVFIVAGIWCFKDASFKLFSKIFLNEPLVEIPEDSPMQRYSISQISAALGTTLRVYFQYIDGLKMSLVTKDTMQIGVSAFVLMFVFYLFLSISDTFLAWFFLNAFLLWPFLHRHYQIGTHKKIIHRISPKKTDEQ